MKKRLVFLLVLCFSINTVHISAQTFNSEYGIHLGNTVGFDVKHFVLDNQALEGWFTCDREGFHLTGLYEYQVPFGFLPGFEWYAGAGCHVGSFVYTDIAGADFVGGLSYAFTFPLCLCADINPNANLIGNSNKKICYGMSIFYYF